MFFLIYLKISLTVGLLLLDKVSLVSTKKAQSFFEVFDI
jgi:hypothetical protein